MDLEVLFSVLYVLGQRVRVLFQFSLVAYKSVGLCSGFSGKEFIFDYFLQVQLLWKSWKLICLICWNRTIINTRRSDLWFII